MIRRLLSRTCVAFALLALPVMGEAGVDVHIGINLPAPPPLVAIPGVPVFYAPEGPANYFFYGDRYYVFSSGAWYVSGGFNGPWVAAAPAQLPPPILAVPVRYYRAPPPGWSNWSRGRPPRWGHYQGNPGRGHGKGKGKGR